MTNIAALFDRAVKHHQRGELDQAELLYREILQAEPRHAESLHLLGYLKHQVGDSDAAISLIRHAIALIPGAAIFHSNLGIVLMDVGLLEEAVDSFGQAVRLKPGFADAYSNLALALKNKTSWWKRPNVAVRRSPSTPIMSTLSTFGAMCSWT